MYAPYAVVEGDSGVALSSASLMPHWAQKDLCVVTSLMMLMIVWVADWMELYVDDFATSRLRVVSRSVSGDDDGSREEGGYPYARA